MHRNKLVTVCITTFNRKELLDKAVKSVLSQSYFNLELIIVDDCSNDGTEQYVNTILDQDQRIRYIRHQKNKGLAAARNTAIFNSTGTYFTFVDDDDRWEHNYIEEFVNVAEQYNDEWCFCCGSVTKDLIGQTVYANYSYLEGDLVECIRQGYTPPVASQFYFTSTLKECGGYNEEIKTGVDHDLWLTLAFRGIKIKSVNKYLSRPSEVMDVSRNKMTNSFQRRMGGLVASLKIWRPQLVANFGESFFHQFYDAYLIREKKKFFRMYMLKLDLKPAYSIYKQLSGEISAKEIFKALLIAFLYKLSIPINRDKYVTRGSSLKVKAPTVIA